MATASKKLETYKSELELQQKAYLNIYNKYPRTRGLFFHIINNARSKQQASQLIAAGLVAGIPDLCLAIPSKNHAALYIELKNGKNGLSPEQVKIHKALIAAGNRVVVCRTKEEVEVEIKNYIGVDSVYLKPL